MTRKQARVASAAGLVPFGHLSCGFHDRADFLARAAEYIADGLEQHQFIAYVGEKSRDALRAELAGMPAIGERSSDIQVTPIKDHYVFLPADHVIDVEACVAHYVEAARQARANGYMGFRAVVDATAVARTAKQRAAMTGLVYLVDQE
ncbi:MAG: MEDS domain-containing protein, partial [Mycobacterium sp.]